MEPDLQIITDTAALDAIASELESASRIAVDLEADSMYHFQERVCLIQMATDSLTAVVDPLAAADIAPLGPIFGNPRIQKVFHGADYDIRSLYRDFGFEVRNLFDTQLACRFLGARETGLEAVLQARYSVVLDKRYQRRDWSKRSLPQEMLAYAADDVRYLLPLAEALESELAEKGRSEWVREECELLSRVRPAENDSDPLFLHFKGAGKLNPRSLAVLEALLHYRKRLALKKDRPLFKVFSNISMLKLAQVKPATPAQLEASGALSAKQVKMYGPELLEVVREGLAVSSDALPVYPRHRAPAVHPAVPARIKVLKQWRDRAAQAMDVEAGLLANRALLVEIAVTHPKTLDDLQRIAELKTWQREAFGPDILNALRRRK